MAASHLIRIAFGFIVNIDKIARFETFEAGEDKFVRIAAVNIASGMPRNHKVADLSGEGAGARNHKLGDTVVHGFESIVVVDVEGDRNVDVKFRNNETRIGGDRAGDGRVDGFDAGRGGFGVWRNVSHNRRKDKAVILEEESAKDDENKDENRDKVFNMAAFTNGAGGDAFVFEFFGSEIVLSSLGVVFAVVILIIVLPGGVILLPFVGNGGLVDWGIFK